MARTYSQHTAFVLIFTKLFPVSYIMCLWRWRVVVVWPAHNKPDRRRADDHFNMHILAKLDITISRQICWPNDRFMDARAYKNSQKWIQIWISTSCCVRKIFLHIYLTDYYFYCFWLCCWWCYRLWSI